MTEVLLLVCRGWCGVDNAAQRAERTGLKVGAYRPYTDRGDPVEAALAGEEPIEDGDGWALFRVDPDLLRPAIPTVAGIQRVHLERLVSDAT